MSSHVDCVAVLTPAEGKTDLCRQTLHSLAKSVQADEPDCLRYQVTYQESTNEFVVIETYKDQSAYDAHSKTAHFQQAIKQATEEQALSKPIEFKILKVEAGFKGR